MMPNFSFSQADSIFSNFYIQQNSSSVLVSFRVKGGIQCNGVTIERSTDNATFQNIFEFPGVCGSPGSDEDYSYTDNSPIKNTENYYRIRVGTTGIVTLTKSLFFFDLRTGVLPVIPNPCSDCMLRFPGLNTDGYTIKIFDYTGKLLLEEKTSAFFYDLSRITDRGVLFLEVTDKNQQNYLAKILKL